MDLLKEATSVTDDESEWVRMCVSAFRKSASRLARHCKRDSLA